MQRYWIAAAALFVTVGLSPASAQTAERTTTVTRSNDDGARVVRKTTVRRTETQRSGYDVRKRVRVCKVRYRDNRRIRTCTVRYR